MTVSNNGTSVAPAGPSSTLNSATSSASNGYRVCSTWITVLLILASMFMTGARAQSLSWGDVLMGVPPDNVQFVDQLESPLYADSIPIIDAVQCGGRAQFLGVADINRMCPQVLGQAPQPVVATADATSAFVFALETTLHAIRLQMQCYLGQQMTSGPEYLQSHRSVLCLRNVGIHNCKHKF